MSGRRAILWLLFASLFLSGVHFLLNLKGGRSSGALVRRVVLAPRADDATAVSVVSPVSTTALSRVSGEWRVVVPFQAAADTRTVLRLLDALAFSPITEAMTDAELLKLGRQRADFGLQPPRLTVETVGRSGAESVSFGSVTPTGDGVYAVVPGVNSVFVVDTNVFAAVGRSTDEFRSRILFSLPAASVDTFDVKCGKGSFMRFARDGGNWRMSEPKTAAVSADRVHAFLSALLAARVRSFVWPVGAADETTASVALLSGYGLDPESAVAVSLRSSAGSGQLVSFGKSAGEGLVYALVHNGGAVVTVDSALRDMARSGTRSFADTRIFPYDASGVAVVSLSDGDDRVLLVRNAAGDWRLDEPVAAPADKESVAGLIARLVTLQERDLDADGILVAVSTNDKPLAVSRQAVYSGLRIERLRSTGIVTIDPLDVRRLVVTPAGGRPTAVVRAADGTAWNVDETASAPGTVDAHAVAALLECLAPLRAVRIEKLRAQASELGEFGLEIPRFTVSIDRKAEGAVRRNILIGDKTEGGRFATLGSADAVFVLADDVVSRLTDSLVRE